MTNKGTQDLKVSYYCGFFLDNGSHLYLTTNRCVVCRKERSGNV